VSISAVDRHQASHTHILSFAKYFGSGVIVSFGCHENLTDLPDVSGSDCYGIHPPSFTCHQRTEFAVSTFWMVGLRQFYPERPFYPPSDTLAALCFCAVPAEHIYHIYCRDRCL
jgi:hypothetical protein